MRAVTIDIETQNFFQDIGSNDPTDLDLSVVCIHDSENDKAMGFTINELSSLWPILEKADILITWNGDHFDIPILNKYYVGDLNKIKSLDLMKEVQGVIGRRLKLDSVANATLGLNKSGHGAEAVEWWRKGEIDKIIKYCIDDVLLTRKLYDYAMANNFLFYNEFNQKKKITLNTQKWNEINNSALNLTLPF